MLPADRHQENATAGTPGVAAGRHFSTSKIPKPKLTKPTIPGETTCASPFHSTTTTSTSNLGTPLHSTIPHNHHPSSTASSQQRHNSPSPHHETLVDLLLESSLKEVLHATPDTHSSWLLGTTLDDEEEDGVGAAKADHGLSNADLPVSGRTARRVALDARKTDGKPTSQRSQEEESTEKSGTLAVERQTGGSVHHKHINTDDEEDEEDNKSKVSGLFQSLWSWWFGIETSNTTTRRLVVDNDGQQQQRLPPPHSPDSVSSKCLSARSLSSAFAATDTTSTTTTILNSTVHSSTPDSSCTSSIKDKDSSNGSHLVVREDTKSPTALLLGNNPRNAAWKLESRIITRKTLPIATTTIKTPGNRGGPVPALPLWRLQKDFPPASNTMPSSSTLEKTTKKAGYATLEELSKNDTSTTTNSTSRACSLEASSKSTASSSSRMRSDDEKSASSTGMQSPSDPNLIFYTPDSSPRNTADNQDKAEVDDKDDDDDGDSSIALSLSIVDPTSARLLLSQRSTLTSGRSMCLEQTFQGTLHAELEVTDWLLTEEGSSSN